MLPFFPPIRRVAPHSLLRQWRLEHGPINALPAPGNAFEIIVLSKACTPQVLKEPGLGPQHELLMDRAGAAEALSSALLGSVSQEVARASTVPVTIVKHAQELDGDMDGED